MNTAIVEPNRLLTQGNDKDDNTPKAPVFEDTTPQGPANNVAPEFDFSDLNKKKREYKEAINQPAPTEEEESEAAEQSNKDADGSKQTRSAYEFEMLKYRAAANRLRITIDYGTSWSMVLFFGVNDRADYKMDAVEKEEFIEAWSEYFYENKSTGLPPAVNIVVVTLFIILGKGKKAWGERKNRKKAEQEYEERIAREQANKSPLQAVKAIEDSQDIPPVAKEQNSDMIEPVKPIPPGTVLANSTILKPSDLVGTQRKCELPSCGTMFTVLKNQPKQRFCSPSCRSKNTTALLKVQREKEAEEKRNKVA